MRFNLENPAASRREKAKEDILGTVSESLGLEAQKKEAAEKDETFPELKPENDRPEKYLLDDAFKLVQFDDPSILAALDRYRQQNLISPEEMKVLTLVLSVSEELDYRADELRRAAKGVTSDKDMLEREIAALPAPEKFKEIVRSSIDKITKNRS